MEDFIFDDDVDEVGAEVEAHCPKCKADTQHVVVSKYEDEIRRVQCNPCGDVHPYRKPRGEEGDEEPAPAVKKKAVKAKPTWEQVMAKNAKKQPKAYQLGEFFKEGELISHPKFGAGFVSENIGDDKIEVTFKDDKRVLVHNRKGLTLPFMRPAATPAAAKGKAEKAEKAEAGGNQGKKKGAKAEKAEAPAPPPPAPAPVASKKAAPAAKGKAAPAPVAKPAPAKPAPAAHAKKPAAAAAQAKKPAPAAHAKKPAAKAAARTASKKPTPKAAAKKVKKGR
jgi:hypothetical protein